MNLNENISRVKELMGGAISNNLDEQKKPTPSIPPLKFGLCLICDFNIIQTREVIQLPTLDQIQ